MFASIRSTRVPYGEIQGFADGVPAYSNGNDEYFSGKRRYMRLGQTADGNEDLQLVFTGYEWQCVEFARRWLLATKGFLLPDVPNAARVFEMSRVVDLRAQLRDGDAAAAARGGSGKVYAPMIAVANGGPVKPTAGSLLIWPHAHGAPFGHIGVIVEVTDSVVRIADQNQHFHDWRSAGYSAELRLEHDERRGTWTVRDCIYGRVWYPLGWMVCP